MPTEPRDDELSWTVHPAADQPMMAAIVGLVVVVATALAVQVSGLPLVGLAGGLLMILSLRAFYLPRHYALDDHEAREHGPLCSDHRMPWGEVLRVTEMRDGVHLSPRLTDSRLLPDRGLYLRTRGNRDAVLAFAESHRGADVRS